MKTYTVVNKKSGMKYGIAVYMRHVLCNGQSIAECRSQTTALLIKKALEALDAKER